VSEALKRALEMPLKERRMRWQSMMDVLERNDITTWRNAFLHALTEPPKVKPEIYVPSPVTLSS